MFEGLQIACIIIHIIENFSEICIMKMELRKKFRLESAHFLPHFPEGHKCRRLHGHSFFIEICVEGACDPHTGVVMDYGDIKKIVKPLVELLDHRLINDVGTEINAPLLMNPTSENIAKWFFDTLHPDLPMLSAVIVYETCTSTCIYRGDF